MSAAAIALTIGDPNGIGPEIAIKAAAQMAREAGPSIVLVGDEFVIRFYAERYAKDFAVEPFGGLALRRDALYVLGVDALPRGAFCPGTPVAAGGRATVDYVSAAMRLVSEKHVSAIVAALGNQCQRGRHSLYRLSPPAGAFVGNSRRECLPDAGRRRTADCPRYAA